MLKITFSAEDYLALFTGIGSNDVKLPQRTITRDDFPDCPSTVVGQPVPILYGDLRETSGAVLDAPRYTTDYARGLLWAGAWEITDDGRATGWSAEQWRAGWGDISGGPDAPGSISLADDTGGNIDTGQIVWVNRIYGQAWIENASGAVGDPLPFASHTVQAATLTGETAVYDDFSADDREMNVTISWPAGATTGWKCHVAVGFNYYGIRWQQRITLNHPATVATFNEFSSKPLDRWGEWPLSTGASWAYTFAQPGPIYTVRAYDANGESPDSAVAVGGTPPYKRPHYLAWSAVTGATGYRVYQWSGLDVANWRPSGSPLRYWDVSSATTWTGYPQGDGSTAVETPDTPARGIPVRHVGPMADLNGDTWEAFLVAGHACKSITAAYLDGEAIQSTEYGATLALPGQTDFTSLFGDVYTEINGHRYTLIYIRGQLATSVVTDQRVLTVDVTGIESVGDGSGTLISDSFQQYEHLLRNWVLRSYTSGAWATSGPTWGDTPYDVDILDGASFIAAKAVADARISGGYVGAFGVGLDDFGTVREWVARLNQSADCYCGFSRKSQFVVKMLDASNANVLNAPAFTAELGILRDTFSIEDDALAIQNQIITAYDYNWAAGDWRRGLTREDTAAQTAIGEVRPYDLQLYATRNAAQANDIAARRLERRKFPYRVVRFESDMGGLTLDLGDLVRISHPDGLGANGWTDRAGFVIRHEFDPNRFVVALDVLDIDFLVNLRLAMPSGSLSLTGQTPTLTVA